MKNKNILPAVLTVVLVVGAGFFFLAKASDRRRRRELEEKLKGGGGQPSGEQPQTPIVTDLNTGFSFTYPIKRGDSGENVRQLQILLLGYDKNILPNFGADGKFGLETQNALSRIIAKNQVSSAQDIALIKNKIQEKAKRLVGGALINAQLGLKNFDFFGTKK